MGRGHGQLHECSWYDYMDAYTEVGGRATQDAKAEVIGTTPGKEEVEFRREQKPRVESGTETESDAGTNIGHIRVKMSGTNFPAKAEHMANM